MGIVAFLVNMVLFAYLAFWLPYVMVCDHLPTTPAHGGLGSSVHDLCSGARYRQRRGKRNEGGRERTGYHHHPLLAL